MKISISKKIAVFLFVMVLIAVINTIVIYHYHSKHEDDSHIVNVAGRQRMLSQKISKLVLSVAGGNESDNRLLGEAIGLYDSSLKTLSDGGKAMREIILPAPPSMNELFKRNKHLWSLFKENAEIVLQKERDLSLFSKATSYIQTHNEKLLEISDDVTGMFDQISHDRFLQVRQVLLLLLAIDIFLMILGSYVANVNIAKPLKELSEFAGKIGRGDFTQKTALPKPKDEIGDLAHAFEGMIKDLQKTTVSKNYVNNIIGSMIDTLIVVDQDAKIRTVNQAACDLLGYSENELIGMSMEEIIAESGSTEKVFLKKTRFQEIFEEGSITNYEIAYKTKEGNHIPMLFSASMMEDREGIIGIVEIAKDITERRKAEEALIARQREIEELNANLEKRVQEELEKSREKDLIMIHQSRYAAMGEMIALIAHQWKQPLNALNILLYNIKDFIDDFNLNEKTSDNFISSGLRLIEKMSATIDDFRKFFQPNKKKKKFSINKIIKYSLSLIDADFKYNNISVIVNGKEDVMVSGFANEYSQVILNILNNAKEAVVARGVDGEIRIDILHEDDSAVVTIKDNGGGIPEDVLHKIFDPYFTTKQQTKGTGIGLYMSRVIIQDHMNGYVDAQNIDDGVEFKITIPILP